MASAEEIAIANTAIANENNLRTKGLNAIQANKNFLAIGAPSAAQQLAQLQSLTRQMNAIIKLSFDLLADTDGT